MSCTGNQLSQDSLASRLVLLTDTLADKGRLHLSWHVIGLWCLLNEAKLGEDWALCYLLKYLLIIIIFFYCGMWDLLVVAFGIQFLDQGLNPGPLLWEHRVRATGPPRSPTFLNLIWCLWELIAYFPEFLKWDCKKMKLSMKVVGKIKALT